MVLLEQETMGSGVAITVVVPIRAMIRAIGRDEDGEEHLDPDDENLTIDDLIAAARENDGCGYLCHLERWRDEGLFDAPAGERS